ncbi:MAG: ATP-binding protein [Pseudomonadota bacterium]
MPRNAIADGRYFIVADAANTVIAQRGGTTDRRGLDAPTLLEGGQPLLLFGTGAGVGSITVDDVPYLGACAKAVAGGLTACAVQSRDALMAGWQSDVSINIALFAAMAGTMLVLLYAYYAQISRTSEADQLFEDMQQSVDTALQRGHCGLWDWDLARGRIYWSRSMFAMLGYDAAEEVLSFHQLGALIHPDDNNLIDIAEEAVSEEISSMDRHLRMRHADGHFVRMRVRTEIVERAGSRHLVGIAVDVSEQDRLKQISKRTSANLTAALESTSESFAIWDANDRLVLCNKKFFQFYGLTPDTLPIGTPRDQFMKIMRQPIHEIVIQNGGHTGRSRTVQRQIADGRWLQINDRTTPDGGTISIGADVSKLKQEEEKALQSEQQLMASMETLSQMQRKEQEKAEALEELNSRFLAEKERAEAASQAKTEFLANVSHELRTPLNAILGFSQMMQQQTYGPLGSDKYDEYIGDIHESGAFLLNVINDILQVSRIEAGTFEMECEDVNLSELASETVQMLAVQAKQKNISVVTEISDGMYLSADRRALKQILINLLSNAVKFTGEAGEVTIRAKCVGGKSIRLSIEDNGCGIPKSALKRIGKPFEQAQRQFSKNHTGTGLGLAISKSLAELHGGTLKIRSAVDRGTIVAVRIPVKGACEAQQKAAA